jgi:beta-glucosidase-like glycosyl hydrolase
MHEQHAKDGLAVVSVNLDAPADKERRKEVLAFLKAKKAAFTNRAPDEKQDLRKWAAELKIEGIPVTDVYDREGKRVKRIEGLDPKELDEWVGRL